MPAQGSDVFMLPGSITCLLLTSAATMYKRRYFTFVRQQRTTDPASCSYTGWILICMNGRARRSQTFCCRGGKGYGLCPRDMGQLRTYVAAVNGIMRNEGANQTIDLLICKDQRQCAGAVCRDCDERADWHFRISGEPLTKGRIQRSLTNGRRDRTETVRRMRSKESSCAP